VGCYIWYSEEGTGRAAAHPGPPRCNKWNSHPSVANVSITVLLYNGPLLYGFNVPIERLIDYKLCLVWRMRFLLNSRRNITDSTENDIQHDWKVRNHWFFWYRLLVHAGDIPDHTKVCLASCNQLTYVETAWLIACVTTIRTDGCRECLNRRWLQIELFTPIDILHARKPAARTPLFRP